MKCTIILIATVFLIGIGVPDVAAQGGKDKKGGEKSDSKGEKKGTEGKKEPEGKKEAAPKGGKKETKPVEEDKSADDDDDDDTQQSSDDDDDDTAGSDQDEEEEEEVKAPPKKGTGKKPTTSQKPKRGPPKRRRAQEDSEEDDEEEVERPRGKGKKSPSLSDLKDQAASMNPANLIAALQKTPVNQLKKVLPQLNQLTKSLKGTPLGPIFENLTSLLGNSSPQIWTQVFQVFPNFVATILNTVGQLTAIGATAFGRAGKSIVDVADVLFNTGKDVLGQVTMLPGGNLLTPFGQVLDLVHGSIVTPIDDIADEVKATAKRSQKRLQRAASRTRSGAGGGLFGGDGGLLGIGGL